ncbi:uncharacterized protein LOC121870046 [Homarus americanus]|uniref:uncharacterized protein LOC121870046 n=1 Tax=Homarus americanus TaxID=6706 RepID=UPI001C4401A0|nr:uncharacterized protein LOC121870046 [Homarus americanus]
MTSQYGQCVRIKKKIRSQARGFEAETGVMPLTLKPKSKPKSWLTEAKAGFNPMSAEVKERWAEYVEELYNDKDKVEVRKKKALKIEMPILETEVEAAVSKLKHDEVCRVDQLPAEIIKQMNKNGIKRFTKICDSMYFKIMRPSQ